MVLFVELVPVFLTIMSFLNPQEVGAIKGKCWGHLGVGRDKTGESVSLCVRDMATPSTCRHIPATSIVDLSTGLRPGLLWASFTFRVPLTSSSFLRSVPSPAHCRAPWLLYHFLAAAYSSCPAYSVHRCVYMGLLWFSPFGFILGSQQSLTFLRKCRALKNVSPIPRNITLPRVRPINQHSQMVVGM